MAFKTHSYVSKTKKIPISFKRLVVFCLVRLSSFAYLKKIFNIKTEYFIDNKDFIAKLLNKNKRNCHIHNHF